MEGSLSGTSYRVGRPEWAAELGLEVSPTLRRGLSEAESRGESVIALTDADQVLALFALADQVRPSARAAIAQLKNLGISPVMITGDTEAVAETVADELGIERYYARVLPKRKPRSSVSSKPVGNDLRRRRDQ